MRKAFALLFTAVMLSACVYVLTQGFAIDRIDQQTLSVRTDLNTNRQRERKQQVEYDQAAAELPENQKKLGEIKPLAEATKATETDLRAQRKQLRADVADLKTAVQEAEKEAESAEQAWTSAEERLSMLRKEGEALLGTSEGEDQP